MAPKARRYPAGGVDLVARRLVGAELSPEGRLTWEETTTTVHYFKFRFTPGHVDAFAAGAVRIVVDHPYYNAVVELTDEQRKELLRDLRD